MLLFGSDVSNARTCCNCTGRLTVSTHTANLRFWEELFLSKVPFWHHSTPLMCASSRHTLSPICVCVSNHSTLRMIYTSQTYSVLQILVRVLLRLNVEQMHLM